MILVLFQLMEIAFIYKNSDPFDHGSLSNLTWFTCDNGHGSLIFLVERRLLLYVAHHIQIKNSFLSVDRLQLMLLPYESREQSFYVETLYKIVLQIDQGVKKLHFFRDDSMKS